jgi:hypothetical protein
VGEDDVMTDGPAKVSFAALMLVAVASCYGNPRRVFGNSGAAGSVSLDAGGGAAGSVSSDAGGEDTAPIACGAGSACPAGTVCGPANLCVGCSEVTSNLPPAPALRRPMRGAYSGSLHAPPAIATLRPTFSWTPVAPTCGAVSYELQADDSCAPGALDACAFPSPELDATAIATTSHAPASDLKVSTTAPVGAFYAWRVRACDASVRCGPWSEVRYLHVGRVREDINGDGYGDLLAPSNRGIEVYLGAAQFNVSAPAGAIVYETYGAVPTFSGDINGDGYGDFFGATIYLPSTGQAPTIYFGGPTITNLATLVLTKTAGGPSTMMQTTSAGDLNGDGFADLIVQWGYVNTTPATELRIFFGGAAIANTPDLSIPGPYASDYTLRNSGRVGDLNGDGFEDIALAAFDGPSQMGVVQFFAGGSKPTSAAVSVPTSNSTYLVEPAGDIDNDGFDDALIVLPGVNYALYRGSATLRTTTFMTWIDMTSSSARGGFDIDRDGFSDFVIGTTTNAPILFRGGIGSPSVILSGLSRLIVSSTVGVSDHDGDGRPDFVGVESESNGGSILWAGSDGTIDPRAVTVRLPVDLTFKGQLVR